MASTCKTADEQKTLRITCTGADALALDTIEDFQGNLKRRGKKEIEQIITSLLRFGFSFPFFIWQNNGHNNCLDGHGRLAALNELRRRGYSLPKFPIVHIEAANIDEAKQKLLRLNSQYGIMSMDSVIEFMGGIEIDAPDLALPRGVLKFNDGGWKPKNTEVPKLTPPDIDTFILLHDRFYFSYSGGRDSTLALAKTWPFLRDHGKRAEAIYVDTGVEFPDLLPYIIRITRSLDIPLRVLHSRRNFLEVYQDKGKWPDAIFRDCIETLISGTIDEYCEQVEGDYVLIRGGRGKQKTPRSGTKEVQNVKAKPNMTIFNPIFTMDQATYEIEIAKLPIWRGYALGFDRTACWCCPFQSKKQWDALKNNYPLLWEEMKQLMNALTWKAHEGDQYTKRIKAYWGRGVKTC